MKKKSVFYVLIALITLAFIGIAVTLILALAMGSSQTQLFDFSNMNFMNFAIVLIIGLAFVCFISTVLLVIVAKIGIENVADFIKNKKWEDIK